MAVCGDLPPAAISCVSTVVFVFCSLGAMLPFRLFYPNFSALSLFILHSLFLKVNAVCTECYGAGEGCTGDPATCPWRTAYVANAAAMGAAAGGVITVSKLLPLRFSRIFTRKVLQVLSQIKARGVAGLAYDFAGKSFAAIRAAVVSGRCEKDDALTTIADLMDGLDPTAADYAAKVQIHMGQLKVLGHLTPQVDADVSASQGAYLFVLAKLSLHICGSAPGQKEHTLDMGSSSSDAGPTDMRVTSRLVRPANAAQMYALLNSYVLVCQATGLANALTLCPFLDDVVYAPVRCNLPWPVAFETLVLYLTKVENEPTAWTLSTVYAKAGGIDVIRNEATAIATGRYPSSELFRAPRGEPREGPGTKKEEYKGKVNDYTHDATQACIAWNTPGKAHLAKHVNQGVCKFFHGCSQWVTDKGPFGQCLGAHIQKNCT